MFINSSFSNIENNDIILMGSFNCKAGMEREGDRQREKRKKIEENAGERRGGERQGGEGREDICHSLTFMTYSKHKK